MDKDILAYLGFNDFNPEENGIDEFKEQFSSKYIARTEALDDEDIRKKALGQVYGPINTIAKREFGFQKSEIEGKDLGEIITMGASALRNKMQELEEQLGNTDSDERIKTIKSELDSANEKLNEYEGKITSLTTDLETKENTYKEREREYKVNTYLNQIKEKIPFKDGMTDIEREGFDNHLRSKLAFDFELNETTGVEQFIVKKEGQKLRNPNKASEFLTPEDVIKEIAETNKLIKVNNGGGADDRTHKPEPPKEPRRDTKELPFFITDRMAKNSAKIES